MVAAGHPHWDHRAAADGLEWEDWLGEEPWREGRSALGMKYLARLSWHQHLLNSQGRQRLRIELVGAVKESSFLSWTASELGSGLSGHFVVHRFAGE